MARDRNARKLLKPLCFVIMPLERAAPSRTRKYAAMGQKELDTIFDLLRGILAKEGYEVKRSDAAGDILRDIVYDLDRSELVCADLTGLNPNVMYELGIRHGFTKRTILLTQDVAELPFDLKTFYCIEYAWITTADSDKLARAIKRTLKRMEADPDTRYGPVHTHLGTKRLAMEEEEKKAAIRKLGALGSELELLWTSLKQVHTVLSDVYPEAFERTGDGWRIDEAKLSIHQDDPVWAEARARWAMSYPAIDLLVVTRYIAEKFDQFGDIDAFTTLLSRFRLQMQASEKIPAAFFGSAHRRVLEALLSDFIVITRAVSEDLYGEDLHLKSKKLVAELRPDPQEPGGVPQFLLS